ncbi:MAG: type II toxin-antitoxin system RelE/ParE family toxin [Desulfovibrionaceae bacterium]|nr:type II toxin-antitoxin system RelE/ParE family toxin [Desulfovibrionaceae bacterium]MBF0514561.1 type II toxin-antitoxin system RelE/ParE family toxin [Desulfovibrionaceae bacterium]
MKTIAMSTKAIRQMKKLGKSEQAAIYQALRTMAAEWPNARGVKALVGRHDYRLRLGELRVIFEVEGEEIFITEVLRRNERTYH